MTLHVQEIVKTLLGPTAENAIIILQVVYLTGCNVCMLMIICDQVSPVLLVRIPHSRFQFAVFLRANFPLDDAALRWVPYGRQRDHADHNNRSRRRALALLQERS